MHSKASPEHYTPEWVVEAARTILGGRIGLDPCSCDLGQGVVLADQFFSFSEKGQDGLTLEWGRPGTTLINPPGGKLAKAFWKRAWDEFRARGTETIFIHFSLEQILSLSKLDGYPSPLECPIWFPSKRIPYDTLGRDDFEAPLSKVAKILAKETGGSRDGILTQLIKEGREQGTLKRVKGANPTHGSFMTLIGDDPGTINRFLETLPAACLAAQGHPGGGGLMLSAVQLLG